MSLIEVSDLDTSPLRYQVDKMIPEVGTGFFWGKSWSGKTLVALDMALSIANGVPFLGHETIPGTVAYFAGEGFGGIGVRVKARLARQARDDALAVTRVMQEQGSAAAEAFAAALPTYTGDNLKIKREPFAMHFDRANKPLPGLLQAKSELARLNQPGPDDDPETWPYLSLVIIDALANYAGQLSISSDASANRITQGMQWLSRELDTCILAIAHPTEKGDKMLGAGRLFNSSDFVIAAEPDDVSAPGALKTATVSCRKSKDDKGFESFGYQIEPCIWNEPVLDEYDQPTGETVEVGSATVRLITEDKPSSAPDPARRPAPPLPEIREPVPVRPPKRNGLRRRLHAVPDLPGAVPVPESVIARKAETSAILDARVRPPAGAKQELARALLAVRCPVCSRPESMGCDRRMPPEPWPLIRTAAGQAWVHEDRVWAVLKTLPEAEQEPFLNEIIAILTPGTTPAAPASPPPAPPVTDRDKRLWWTTVRPDRAEATP